MSAGFQNEKGMYRNDNYKQITFRTVTQKFRKIYDRKRLKRAVIKGDDGSYFVHVSSI